MLKKHSKPMFFILLIPFYFLILSCLFGMSIGSIEWIMALEDALVLIVAAWGLSRYNSLVINIIGLIFFVIPGANLIYSSLTKTTRIGPWTLSIYLGVILILFGLIAFIYDIIKLK